MTLTSPITTRFDFANLFNSYGRGNQFTCAGFDALFEYLEELSEDLGEDLSLDVIGLCCEWCEYESLQELAEAYSGSWIEAEDIAVLAAGEDHPEYDNAKDRVLEEFCGNGQLIETGIGGYLFAE